MLNPAYTRTIRPRAGECFEEEQSVYVPEMIENGGEKLSLALGGLAVANLTSMLMLSQIRNNKRFAPRIYKSDIDENELSGENIAKKIDKYEKIIEKSSDSLSHRFLTLSKHCDNPFA